MKRILLLLLWFFCAIYHLMMNGQDLEKMMEKPGVKISGSLSASYSSQNLSGLNNLDLVRTGGQLNIAIGDFSLPFSFTWSRGAFGYSQPFNRFGLEPEFKKWKLILGYKNPEAPDCLLSGIQALGAGISYGGSKIKASVFFGKINTPDLRSEALEETIEKKFGLLSLGFSKKNFELSGTTGFTSGKDPEKTALHPVHPFQPESNLFYYLKGHFSPGKMLKITGEYARSEMFIREEKTIFHSWNFSESEKSSLTTADRKVLRIQVRLKKNNLSLNFEETSPDYRTHAAPYAPNDLTNMALEADGVLFSCFRWLLKPGFQKNNLDQSKISTNFRMAISGNLNYSGKNGFMAGAGYNSFQSVLARPDPSFLNLLRDSSGIFSSNQTQAMNGVLTKQFKNEKRQISLGITASHQQIVNRIQKELQGIVIINNFNTSFSLRYPKKNITIKSGLGFMSLSQGNFKSDNLTGNAGFAVEFPKRKMDSFFHSGVMHPVQGGKSGRGTQLSTSQGLGVRGLTISGKEIPLKCNLGLSQLFSNLKNDKVRHQFNFQVSYAF
jgi:hypothetical protein